MLQKALAHQGSRMYRWRGYLPLLMIPVLVYGFRDSRYFGGMHALDMVWEFVCLLVAGVGLGIRCFVMGYSQPGTSFVGHSTDRADAGGLKTKGPFSLCRNPLYLGNFVMGLGVFMFQGSVLVVLIYVLAFCLYYERLIMGEEEFLAARFGEAYARWAERTPAIIPRFSLWVRPDHPFSWRMAVRREYKRIFAVVAIMTIFEVIGDYFIGGSLRIDPVWAVLFIVALAFYVSVRVLKRMTRLLDIPPRHA